MAFYDLLYSIGPVLLPGAVLPYPEIDPIALDLGFFAIRWYGLSYMAGLLLGWLYVRHLVGRSELWAHGTAPMPVERVDDLIIWVTLGVVLGGRIGYVLFYNPAYFAANPLEIFAVWHGGMSFHGGLLGTFLAIYLFTRRYAAPLLPVLDIAAAAAPIGLFFGRIANFVNGELWGRVTDVPWAMIFPGAGPDPRHPSQLYEAALEGLLLFLVLRHLTHSRIMLQRPGFTAGAFALGYGLARIFVEFFRQFDVGVGLMIGPFTPGMIYSLPLVVAGALLMRQACQCPARV